MNVEQLIRLLRSYPPDLRVMVQGYEEGFDDLEAKCVAEGEVSLNVHSAWYYGRHEEVWDGHEKPGHETARALFLRRAWHDDEE